MCRAFTDKIWCDGRLNESNIYIRDANTVDTNDSEPSPCVANHKRRASTDLESEPKKVAKHSKDDESSSRGALAETAELSISGSEDFNELRDQLKKAGMENQIQGQALEEIGRERDEWRLKAIRMEEEIKDLKEKLVSKSTKEKATGLDLSKRLEKEIKDKYENKLKDQKKDHDENVAGWKKKYQQALKKMEDMYRDKVKELNKKHQDQQSSKDKTHEAKIEELKEKDQKRQKELKEFKAQHLQIQKDLKAEQQAKIKKARPETNSIIKEKEKALDASEKENTRLQDIIDKKSKNEKRLEHAVDSADAKAKRFEQDANAKEAEKADLQLSIDSQAQAFSILQTAKKEMQVRYEQKLDHEARRWQIEWDKARDLGRRLVEQQRNNFVLSHAEDRKGKRIEELEAELTALNSRVSIAAVSDAMNQTEMVAKANRGTQTDSKEERLESVDKNPDCKNLSLSS